MSELAPQTLPSARTRDGLKHQADDRLLITVPSEKKIMVQP